LGCFLIPFVFLVCFGCGGSDTTNNQSIPLNQAVVSVNSFEEKGFFSYSGGYKFVHNAQGNYRKLNITATFEYHPDSNSSSVFFNYGPITTKKYIEKWDSGDEIKFDARRERIEKITLFIEGDFIAGDNIIKKFEFKKNWLFEKPFDKP